MKKKKELREETLKYMKELKLPEKIINDYENNIVNVTEIEDDKISVYDIKNNQKARDYALPVGELLETEVFHVIKKQTNLGESWYFLILPGKEEKINAYAYYPESPLNSNCNIVEIEIKNDGVIISENTAA